MGRGPGDPGRHLRSHLDVREIPSVMGRNYPKREIDGALAFIASGRDVRLFVITVVSVLATIDADILFWALVTLAAAIHLTFLYRVVALKGVMNRAD